MSTLKNRFNKLNVKLLAIVFVSILVLTGILTCVSAYMIYSSLHQLHQEKMQMSSRVIQSNYTYEDFLPYIKALESVPDLKEKATRYMEDRLYLFEIDEESSQEDTLPDEYYRTQERMADYLAEFAKFKDDRYLQIHRQFLNLREATGVKYLYMLVDVGLDDLYMYVLDASPQDDADSLDSDDLGTVDLKINFTQLDEVFRTGKPSMSLEYYTSEQYGTLYCSYDPVMDEKGNVIAVICTDVSVYPLDLQVNQFILLSIIIFFIVSAMMILLLMVVLNKLIIRPISSLTKISSEVAKGNLRATIPDWLVRRSDEMGILGRSFSAMNHTIQNMTKSTTNLFQAAATGRLDARQDAPQLEGDFSILAQKINETLDVVNVYLDSIPGGLLILDPGYEIVYSNQYSKKTFGQFDPKLIYQKLLNNPDQDDIAILKHNFGHAMEQNTFETLFWLDLKDGRHYFSFMCSPVSYEDNAGAVVVVMDSTELAVAKDRAELASQAKSEFLSRVSHELRTPLNVILGMAKLGLGDTEIAGSRARFEKIVMSSGHLADIINDVLEMSRMESGKTQIRYAPVNLDTIINECIELTGIKRAEKQLEFLTSFDPQIPKTVIGDGFRIRQILVNFLSNAIKFTEQGHISLDVTLVSTQENHVTISFKVSDTGIGMSEAFLEKIFVPFEQEDIYLKRRYEGSGLGLSISHNLAILMGGDILVESRLNQGSTLDLRLPFEVTDAQVETKDSTSDQKAPVSLGGKRLLLVDDIEINRAIVCEIFNDTGLQIEEASDGNEAYDKFFHAPSRYYDCILMDVQMPNLNGYEATKLIRESGKEDASLPIIAMTANALKEDVDAALRAGMDDHIAKPIDFDVCLQTVAKYCTPS